MNIGILGAGFAGLSCAWLAKKQGLNPIVFERKPYAGGLARSFDWHGFQCDFAAHRLFTQDEEVLKELLALTPMISHSRQSQIYFNSQWMDDPLDVIELGKKTELPKIKKIIGSYLKRPKQSEPTSFKTFVVQKYGDELYDYFFRPYTEKLFGIPGETIALSWAQTKVRLAGPLDRFKQNTKTKFREFHYPKRGGYGAIAEALYSEVKDHVRLNSEVTALEKSDSRVTGVCFTQNEEKQITKVDTLISTLPLTITGRLIGCQPKLSYRTVHAVYLLLDKPQLSPNHWIYFMDDNVVVNRMVEFKNLSSIGVPKDKTVVCAEVTSADADVVERVVEDLVKIGLIDQKEILDSMVVSEPYSYPIYDIEYENQVATTQTQINKFNNLHTVGRAAEFKHREVDDNFASALETMAKIGEKNMRSAHVAHKKQALSDFEPVKVASPT